MEILHVNFLAVLIAAVINYIIGALWYSVFPFSKLWAKHLNIKPNSSGMLLPMLMQFIATFLLAWLGIFILNYGYSALALAAVAYIMLGIAGDLFRGTSKVVISIDYSYIALSVLLIAGICRLFS